MDLAWFTYLIRSKSLSFANNRKNKDQPLSTYFYNGKPLKYRAGTSDMAVIKEILLKKGTSCEYWLPDSIEPKTILDIGGNIGITSILFAKKFPKSIIHSFEPLKDNFEIMSNNVSEYLNIHTHPYGLGDKNDQLTMYKSHDADNFAAWSIYPHLENIDESNSIVIDIKDAKSQINSIGIKSFDLIKIDTEGAEYPIIKSIGSSFLKKTQLIVGELHGNYDYEFLSYLNEIGFNIRTNIKANKPHFMFYAISDQLLKNMTRKEIRILNHL